MGAVYGDYTLRIRSGQAPSTWQPWSDYRTVNLPAPPSEDSPAEVLSLTSIDYHAGGIGPVTITFSEARNCVRYGDGTWAVQGPVTITSMTPASVQANGQWVHGAMVNPGQAANGYSGHVGSSGIVYTHASNVDPGATGSPLVVAAGNLVVKAHAYEARPNPEGRGCVRNYAVLHVVSTLPTKANAFRPPLLDRTKTRTETWADLDMTRVPNLPAVAGQTAVATVLARLRAGPRQGLVRDHEGGRFFATEAEMLGSGTSSGYFPNIANVLIDAALVACTDAPTADEKREIMGRLVQIGLDYRECAVFRGGYEAKGALNIGHKLCHVLAARLLGDATMLSEVDGDANLGAATWDVGRIHAEDWHVFDVALADTTRTLAVADPLRPLRIVYDTSHIGVPDASAAPFKAANTRDAGLNADYRSFHDSVLFGSALAANLITGARAAWNRESLFEYADRAAGWLIGEGFGAQSMGVYANAWRALWTAHRASGPALYVPPPEAPEPPSLKVNGDHIEVFWSSFEVLHGSALVRREVRFSTNNGSSWSSAFNAGLGVSYDLDVNAENTKTLVQYRLVSAVGTGAWSRSHPWQVPGDGTFALGDAETQGMITTGLAAAYDSRPFFERGLIGHYDATDAATLTGSPLQWAPKTAGGPTLVATGTGVTASGGWVSTNGTHWLAGTLAAPVTTGQATVIAITEAPAGSTTNNRPNIIALQGVNGSLDILAQELRWDGGSVNRFYLTGNNRSSTNGVSRFTRFIPSNILGSATVQAGATTGPSVAGVRSISNGNVNTVTTSYAALNSLTTIRVGARTGSAGTGDFGDVAKVRKIAIYDREMTLAEINAVLATLAG